MATRAPTIAPAAAPLMPATMKMKREVAKRPQVNAAHGEDTAAYQVLRHHGLLDTSYRLDS